MQNQQGITLIGLPGSGKSSVGVLLAKEVVRPFLDTDIELQARIGDSLQRYMDANGVAALRAAEGACIRALSLNGQVVATGGSAVYDSAAMRHLSRHSHIVYLEVGFETMIQRIGDFSNRGIAADTSGGLEQMFNERIELYRRYADHTVDAEVNIRDVVSQIQQLTGQ